MSLPREPGQLGAELQTRAREQQLGEKRADYTKMEELERLLFGEPNTPEGSFVRTAWQRLQEKKGYTLEKQRLMLTMRQTADKIFAAMRKRIDAQGATQKETREKLDALDAYLQTVGGLGQALKVQKSPYLTPGEGGVQSTRDTMETEELLVLSRVAEYFQKLDVEELINMILEDQVYITMLVELHNVEGSDKAIVDYLPQGYRFIEIDKGKDGKPIGKLDPENKDHYRHNLKHLREFILGKPEEGGKAKSGQRRMAETSLWLGIIRVMDFRQKHDLVETFLTEGTAKEAEDFITACVLAGVMSKEDVVHMAGEAKTDPESPFKKLSPDIEKKVDRALASRARTQEQMQSVIDQTENIYIQNAANHYITFNNLVMGRVAEFGALTVVLNVILDVADRYRRRTETGREEGRAEAIAKGFADALKNRWVWVGAGAATTFGSKVFTGSYTAWARALALRESKEEKEQTGRTREISFLREQIGNHPELDEYFLQHYDEYLEIARKRERETGTFDLQPGDVKLKPEEAGKLGYESAEAGTAVICRMFSISAKVFQQENEINLAKFFADNIYGKNT
jgi:hypothetical protein